MYDASITKRHARLAPKLRIKVDIRKIFEEPLNEDGFWLSPCSHNRNSQVSQNMNSEKLVTKAAKHVLFIIDIHLSEINQLFFNSIDWFYWSKIQSIDSEK